jgi:hypothetical protein
MAQRIDDASKSQYNLEYDVSETTRLANDISASANSLARRVRMMKDDLNSFVSVLEGIQVTVKKEPSPPEKMKQSPPEKMEQSWLEKFLGWVKRLLKAIARIPATVYRRLRPSPEGPEPKSQDNLSILEEGAATFSDPGAFLEHIILPLQGQK